MTCEAQEHLVTAARTREPSGRQHLSLNLQVLHTMRVEVHSDRAQSTDCSLPAVPRSISFLCTRLSSPSERLPLCIDVLKFTGLLPAPSPQIHQLTAASVRSAERPSQTPKCKSGGLRAFNSPRHNISLCAAHWPPLSPEKDGTAESPRTLRIWTQDACAAFFGHLRGTVNVSVMGLRDGDGNEHTVVHQSSMALLPFRYRYPLRHKAPAASSGRLTHNIGHQCNTAPFRPLRDTLSQQPKCLSIRPAARLHAQWTQVDSSCV